MALKFKIATVTARPTLKLAYETFVPGTHRRNYVKATASTRHGTIELSGNQFALRLSQRVKEQDLISSIKNPSSLSDTFLKQAASAFARQIKKSQDAERTLHYRRMHKIEASVAREAKRKAKAKKARKAAKV